MQELEGRQTEASSQLLQLKNELQRKEEELTSVKSELQMKFHEIVTLHQSLESSKVQLQSIQQTSQDHEADVISKDEKLSSLVQQLSDSTKEAETMVTEILNKSGRIQMRIFMN